MKNPIQRNHIWGILLSLLLLFLMLGLPDNFLESDDEILVSNISSLGIAVHDIDAMSSFYIKYLGFKKVKEQTLSSKHLTKIFGGKGLRIAVLALGPNTLTLIQDLNQDTTSVAKENNRQQTTLLVKSLAELESSLQKVVPRVTTKKVSFEKSNDGKTVQVLFLRDIENNFFRFVEDSFTSNSQIAPYQIAQVSLLTKDLDATYAFYHDLLGLDVVERGVYQGPFPVNGQWIDEKFEIIRFATLHGPSLEFLKPSSPLYYPKKDNGLIWYAKMLSKKLYILKNLLKIKKENPPKILNINSSQVAFKQAMLVRDPDGHPILIAKP